MAEAKLDDRGEGCGERPVCAGGEGRVRAGGLTARGPENPRRVGLAIPECPRTHTRAMTARRGPRVQRTRALSACSRLHQTRELALLLREHLIILVDDRHRQEDAGAGTDGP